MQITDPAKMAGARGMRMGYAPLLTLLEPAIAAGHKRIAVIGIPCQSYALRALEAELGLERLYVIGTPSSDNMTTEAFHDFLGLLSRPGSGGKRARAVKGGSENTRRAACRCGARRTGCARSKAGSFPAVAPLGVEFARDRVEMKDAETILHLRHNSPPQMAAMVPPHVWELAAPYRLRPDRGEQKENGAPRR